MRNIAYAIFGLVIMAGPSLADTTLIATRPGLMCTSAKALATLTLEGGGSRIGTGSEKPGDKALKVSGGCIDIPQGATVFASAVRQQTTIISFDAADGRGARKFIVPNADLSPPGPMDAADPNNSCQALGNRMAQQHKLPAPVTNTKEFMTWRAACSETSPTGPGNVTLLCEGDIPHRPGSPARVFYWEKQAGSQTLTGSLPCQNRGS